eukprot:m.123826 g.123826  ORF g.123826 m.123826 type:complete len:58 (+) comp23399_c1_seq3:150-323(+)
MPKGGRDANNLILREDQKEARKRAPKVNVLRLLLLLSLGSFLAQHLFLYYFFFTGET